MSKKGRVLAIVGHTDDETIMCGGTLSKMAEDGWETAVAFATQSDQAYLHGTGEARRERAEQEAIIATELLNVNQTFFYPFKDMYLGESKGDFIRECIRTIRQFKPDLVITHSPGERHTDHRACARYVPEACVQAGQDVAGDMGLETWTPKQIWHGEVDLEGFNTLNPHILVDITGHISEKHMALQAYASLTDEHSKLFGQEHLKDYVYSNARLRGLAAGVKYAEAFRIGDHLPIKIYKGGVRLWEL